MLEEIWDGNPETKDAAWHRLEESVKAYSPERIKRVRLARMLDKPMKRRARAFISRNGNIIEIVERWR